MNMVESGHRVVVGDANGVDKAVQAHFHSAGYPHVTVYYSGNRPRNNVGGWATRRVPPPKGAKGYALYAAKDREMAHEATFGLMIWDGKSPGTVLNVLRLARQGKASVLFEVPEQRTQNIKSIDHWKAFLDRCDESLRRQLHKRASPEEWVSRETPSGADLFTVEGSPSAIGVTNRGARAKTLPVERSPGTNEIERLVKSLAELADERGIEQLENETGLSRRDLERILSSENRQNLLNLLKVLSALGVSLDPEEVHPA